MISRIIKEISTLTKGEQLKSKIGRGAIWTFCGYAGGMFLRMLSSLILTRIFMPDVFGLMAIITAVLIGIELISDVGIAPSIIQNPKGNTPKFLKTAWTFQLIRGGVLCGGLILVSETLAELYKEESLKQILPVIGITFIIKGLTSTSIPLHQRSLNIEPLIKLELSAQLFNLVVIFLLAITLNSIWAFVFAAILQVTFSVLGSYFYLKGGVVGIEWNREIAKEMIRFGKWIFLATILTFVVGKGDRLLLGTVVNKTDLGLYNLATLFAHIALGLLVALTSKLIMPALSSVSNSTRVDLSYKFDKVRKFVLGALLPFTIILAIFGEHLIKLFYDVPYHNAGWMLQILSAGMALRIICLSLIPIFLSKGDSFRHMLIYLSWSIIFVTSMLIGFEYMGIIGVLVGISLAPLLWLPIILYMVNLYQDLFYYVN